MKSPLKVLMCIPSYYGWTGAAVNERQLSLALAKFLSRIYVVTFVDLWQFSKTSKSYSNMSYPANMKIISIPIIIIPKLTLFTYLVYSFPLAILVSVMRVFKIVDLVYVRNTFLAFGFLMLKKFTKPIALKVPSFISDEWIPPIRNPRVKKFMATLIYKIERFVISRADLLIVHSQLFGFALKRRYPCAKGKAILDISAGVDLKYIQSIQKAEGIFCDEIRIGFIGLLERWQGIDVLIKACALIQKTNKRITLYIVGGGPLLRHVKRMVQDLGVRAVITGPVQHAEAIRLLKSFHTLVVPRIRTTTTELIIPLKLIEAFATGVPVIITRHKVLERVFEDKKDVIYTEPEPKELARKLTLLISSKDIHDQLNRRGKELAKNFNYDTLAKKLMVSLELLVR